MSRAPGLLVWDPRFLEYDFGPDHPFTERSRRSAVDLWRTLVPPGAKFEEAGELEPASRAVLERFHESAYLDRVEECSARGSRAPLDQGDTPAFHGCFEAAARIVQGGVQAVDHALAHRTAAFHPSGGLHHAHPGAASGFCIFNDLAVAVAGPVRDGRRVAYIDLDAHHGDGVMYGFYRSGRVLDIDFHQDGRTLFPGRGFVQEVGEGDGAGLKVNVPLPPLAGDRALLSIFERVVPTLLRSFRPDLIIVQHGADGHAGDPLTALQYTRESFDRIDQLVGALATELSEGRLVVAGGGGYRPESVARVLARAGARALGWPVPEPSTPLPDAWRAGFSTEFGRAAPVDWAAPVGVPALRWQASDADALIRELSTQLGVRFPESGAP